jgi:hypothetical protein
MTTGIYDRITSKKVSPSRYVKLRFADIDASIQLCIVLPYRFIVAFEIDRKFIFLIGLRDSD